MAKSYDEKTATSTSAKIASGLHKYRKVILYTLIAVVAILAVLAIASILKQRKTDAGTIVAEELQESYAKWLQASDDEKASLEKEVLDKADAIKTKYRGTFPHQRALLVLGNLAFEKSQWDDAQKDFAQLAKEYPKSYLAPVALMNQAAALEEAGKNKEAVEIYQKVFDTYKETSPDAPRALFSIARLYETTGQNEAALDAYREVADSFPDSDWTKLSRDRIIYLETH